MILAIYRLETKLKKFRNYRIEFYCCGSFNVIFFQDPNFYKFQKLLSWYIPFLISLMIKITQTTQNYSDPSKNLSTLFCVGLNADSPVNETEITPFSTFLSTMATRRPLAHKAVAMKIPRVPPHTNTSYDPSALSARSDEPNKLGMVETTCWGSCTTAMHT